MLKALIFDMDGVLLDSEPFWMQAESQVFASLGLHLTNTQLEDTTGLRIDEVVAYRYQLHPWTGQSQAQVTQEILKRVVDLVSKNAEALPGVHQAVLLAKKYNLATAVCSSSPYALINKVLQRLELTNSFGVVHSAESDEFGKPHPAPYLATAKKLGVFPSECLVVEDSLNGMLSAKAARMKVIAIPEQKNAQKSIYDFCDFRLSSLVELDEKIIEMF